MILLYHDQVTLLRIDMNDDRNVITTLAVYSLSLSSKFSPLSCVTIPALLEFVDNSIVELQ